MLRPRMNVTPLAAALGAEIGGVNLNDLTDDEVAAIRAVWLRHLVVFFRDQAIDARELLAFAARLGRPVEYPFLPGVDGCPQVVQVLKLPHELVNFGGVWHSDTAYLDDPPMATVL